MRKIRINKDITTRWRIKTNGQATSLSGRDLSLYLIDPVGNYQLMPFSVTDTNLLTFVWYGKDQDNLGDYSLVLFENAGKVGECAVDAIGFVSLVSDTTKETAPSQDDIAEVTAVSLTGDLTTNGRGASAYELWLAEGGTGTIDDFFAWIRQPATEAASTANSAASAANSAASNATTAAGTATAAATAAISAASHQPYINSTNNHWMVYTNGSYVDSGVDAKGIKGNDGAPGAAGKDGADGKDGAPGKDGKDGSDASVTAANIQTALGFAPAKASDVTSLDSKIGNLEKGVRVNIITDGTNRVVLPNFDIAAKTLSIGGDVGVEICGTHYGVRNLVVNMRPAASTAFKLWFDTSSKTFVATLFGTTPLSTYVLVGAYRWSNDGSIYLDFPFEVTFNGDINTRGRYYSPSVTPWTSKAYVDGLVGDINTILTAIVG